jgi:AAHS family 4-hydroxybenzoate transporter-like MFS transporter
MLGAALIVRLGSRLSMLTMAAAAIGGAVVLAMMQIGPENTVAVFAILAWTGGLINAVQTTMYALAAHVYPTSVRATGVGTAVACHIGGVQARASIVGDGGQDVRVSGRREPVTRIVGRRRRGVAVLAPSRQP